MAGFRCYISRSGDNVIAQWFAAQSPNVRGATFAVIESLCQRPRHLWGRRLYGQLRGPFCLGLGEIRIEEPRRTHYRILGFFLVPTSDFVLLHAFAKDTDPAYTSACPEAQTRRSEIEQ